MSAVAPKRFAILLSAAPASERSHWALDAALAAAALDQAVTLILTDDALLHLVPHAGDETARIDFGALHHYGIEEIHASTAALEALGPIGGQLRDDLAVTWLDDSAIGRLLTASEVVLSA